MRLTGKVALVTGAGQGIGEAIALKFAEEGADLILVDLNRNTVEQTASQVESRGRKALALTADVASASQMQGVFGTALGSFSGLDVLVNNAGFDRPATLANTREEHWDQVLGVHLKGCLNCSRLAAQAMQSRGGGSIVNISSIYGKIGTKGELAYCTAKAGLIGMTKGMAQELGKYNIRVNVVLPGLTDTPTIRESMKDRYKEAIIRQTPLGRMAHPLEIANVVAFLASDEASFMTGSVVEVSGGWGM